MGIIESIIKEKIYKKIKFLSEFISCHKRLFIATILLSIVLGVVLKFNFVSIMFSIIIFGLILPISFYDNKILIMSQLLISMFILSSTLYLDVSKVFKYVPDLFTLIIMIKLFIGIFKKKIKIKIKYIVIFGGLFAINVVSAIVNNYNILAFIIGLRSYFVFYISFLGYVYLDLRHKDIKYIINSLVVFSFIQIPFTIVQYFYYKEVASDRGIVLFQDFVSGTFGENLNGDLGFLITIVFCIIVAKFLYGQISIKRICLLSLFAIPVILGEIKITILALPIVIIFMIMNKISKKSLVVATSSLLIVMVVFAGLLSRFPEFKNMFKPEYIKYYAYDLGYGSYKLNRLSAPIYVNNEILESPVQKAIGIGVGNGSDNGAEILNSDFYKENPLLGAELFFSSLFLMENGWLGMLLILILLISIFINTFRLQKNSVNNEYKIYGLAIKGIFIMILISLLYSLSIFNLTMGYVIWFMMANVERFNDRNMLIEGEVNE